MRVKRILTLAQELSPEEFDLLVQLRKAGTTGEKPKRRKYTRKPKTAAPKAEAAPKRAPKGNGDEGLAFPKPGKKRGRPRKVHSMIPAPEPLPAEV